MSKQKNTEKLLIYITPLDVLLLNNITYYFIIIWLNKCSFNCDLARRF